MQGRQRKAASLDKNVLLFNGTSRKRVDPLLRFCEIRLELPKKMSARSSPNLNRERAFRNIYFETNETLYRPLCKHPLFWLWFRFIPVFCFRFYDKIVLYDGAYALYSCGVVLELFGFPKLTDRFL